MEDSLLRVENLKTHFYTHQGVVKVLDGVSFSLNKGEVLGVVGESGSGKSMTALSILGMVPFPGRIVGGKILFSGENLIDADMAKIRGNKISMIFQDPMTSLNPVYRIGNQISEVFRIHEKLNKAQALEKSISMLELVGIPEPEKRVHEYPHQLSGGMRQRVMIAIGLSCNPDLLIADEPTTALDVTIQAQILELMNDLKQKTDTAIMLITHDLGVVAEMAQNVMVMYAGNIMEYADVITVLKKPRHPYTVALLKSIPRIARKAELTVIDGTVPSLMDPPSGCKFHPRCEKARPECRDEEPELTEIAPGHMVRCFHWENND